VTPSGSPPDRREMRVGYSTCPNDTFVFHALVTGRVPTPGIVWRPFLADVEVLNGMALRGDIPFTKLSFHAYGAVRDRYVLLASGAALGRGCGPLLLARPEGPGPLESARIAIPGAWTTAALLLRLYAPQVQAGSLVPMVFDRIPRSIARGEVDAGVIIHETRFTYASMGLIAVADLGAWWEAETGLPLPLGGIAADRGLGRETILGAQDALRRSVQRARAHPEEAWDYVREHAAELDPEVLRSHIDLYVNDFTEDLGEEGVRAVETLLDRATSLGLVRATNESLLTDGPKQ